MRSLMMAAAGLALTGLVFAQGGTPDDLEPNPDPRQTEPQLDSAKLYDGITADEMEAVLKGGGLTYERKKNEYGEWFNLANSAGYNFQIFLYDCSEETAPRCITLNLDSFNFLTSPKVTLKGLNDFNTNNWGVKALLYKSGESQVMLQIGLNGGVTGPWILGRIANFDYALSNYSDFQAGRTPPPAQDPPPETPAPN